MAALSIHFTESARCPKCGGMLAYDGSYTRSLPLGFGFVGTKFQIDVVKERGWSGECMNCLQKVLAWTSRRAAVKYPKAINSQIAVARKALA